MRLPFLCSRLSKDCEPGGSFGGSNIGTMTLSAMDCVTGSDSLSRLERRSCFASLSWASYSVGLSPDSL